MKHRKMRAAACLGIVMGVTAVWITACAQRDVSSAPATAPKVEPLASASPLQPPAQRPLKLVWNGTADVNPRQLYNPLQRDAPDMFAIIQFVDDDHIQLVEFRRSLGNLAPRTQEALRIKILDRQFSSGVYDGTFEPMFSGHPFIIGSGLFYGRNCTDEELNSSTVNFCNSGFVTKMFLSRSHGRQISSARVNKIVSDLFDSDTSARLVAFRQQVEQAVDLEQQRERQKFQDAADARQAKCVEEGLGDRKSVIAKAQQMAQEVALRCKAAGIDQFQISAKSAVYCETKGCNPFRSSKYLADPLSDPGLCAAVSEQHSFEQQYFQNTKQMNVTYTPMMYISIGGGACPQLP